MHQRKNLLWLMLDSLRYDTFQDTPTALKDDLLRHGVQLTRCYTQGCWTYPSVASFLTGRLPINTGVSIVHLGDPSVTKHEWRWIDNRVWQISALRTELPTVFDAVHEAGYDTLAFCNTVLLPDYPYRHWNRRDEHFDHNVNDALIWLAEPRERPFFLFYRTEMTHSPWMQLPQPVDWNRYTAMIRDWGANRKIGKAKRAMAESLIRFDRDTYVPLRNRLRDAGLWENTVTVVMSDHGDSVWETYDRQQCYDVTIGGYLEGHPNCYDETIHVVAGWIDPQAEATTIDHLTRLIDLPTTLLPAIGVDTPRGVDGVNVLVPAALAAIDYSPCEAAYHLAVRTDRAKLIFEPEKNRWASFDLCADPLEMDPESGQAELESLLQHLRTYLGTTHLDQIKLIDAKITRERLKALGYL